jgi:neutral ceramidase
MYAGVGAADFTPDPGLILQGHLSKNPSHAVLYPLEARAIIFRDNQAALCLITLDVIGIDLSLTRLIRQTVSAKTGIAAKHITVAASHTHCAPAMLHNLAMTPDAGFLRKVESAAVHAAIDANANPRPVTLGLGCGSAYFNVNRRPLPGQTQFSLNWGGIVDHRVRVLRVDGPDDRPIAVLFHFSCHPTTKVGSEGFISSDYPGVARKHIESSLGCPALFMPGCFGNVRPQINGTFASATKEQLDGVGKELARSVCRAVHYITTRPAAGLSSQEAELHLPFGAPKPEAELEQLAQDTSTPGHTVRAQWARRTLDRIRRKDLPVGVTSVMQAVRIGPLMIVTIPGEAVQEIGFAVESRLAGRGDVDDVWATGYTNDQVGYLVTEKQKEEGGYEPNAFAFYDRPAGYREEENVIVKAAEKLCLSDR